MTDLQDSIHRRLLDFRADTLDPRWSSYALNEFCSSVDSAGGSFGEILQTLFQMLDQSQLSPELANFIKDLTKYAFVSSFRESFRASNLTSMCAAVRNGCTAPQAYLAIYSIPSQLLDPESVVSLFKALAGTPFWTDAVSELEPETHSSQTRYLLSQWLASHLDPNCRPDVERMISFGSGGTP